MDELLMHDLWAVARDIAMRFIIMTITSISHVINEINYDLYFISTTPCDPVHGLVTNALLMGFCL